MHISLVVPVKDEEWNIRALLESVSNQTRLPDEVIFIDAGSTDKTRDIIEGYRKERRFEFKIFPIGPAYPGRARNEGVEKARYELIAFTDGGIEVDKDWLEGLSAVMEKDASIDVVYGSYIPRTDTFFKRCLALAVVPPPIFIGRGKMRPHFIASSLMRKSVWREVGGFPDSRAAEDRIFMERIAKKGFHLAYNPKAVVVWDIPQNLKSVFNRFYNYSYHDLKAGRARDWHIGVLKMYLVAAPFVLLALFVSPIFILLPSLGFAFRVVHKLYINRDEPYFELKDIPQYLAFVAFLIFFIDMACLAGWIKYMIKVRLR